MKLCRYFLESKHSRFCPTCYGLGGFYVCFSLNFLETKFYFVMF